MDYKNIKLVVSDLDGTLLNADSHLNDLNKEMVLKLKDKGVKFTFATGRMDKMTWHFAQEVALELPIISCNGAAMRYLGEKEPLYSKVLSQEQLEKINEICSKYSADYLFYTLDKVYYSKGSKRIEVIKKYNKIAESGEQVPVEIICLDQLENGIPQEPINKTFIRFEEGEDHNSKLGMELNQIEGVDLVVSSHGTADLIPEHTSKGEAVEYLAKSLNIDMKDVMTLGDQMNDISMLEKSGLAVAMQNATAEVKAHADIVADHHDNDGLGKVLKRIFEL